MVRIFCSVLLSVLILSNFSAARAQCKPTDFVGFWKGYVEKDVDKREVELTLRADGTALKGSASIPMVGLVDVDIVRAEIVPSGVKVLIPLPLGALDLRSSGECTLSAGDASYVSLVKREWISQGGGKFQFRTLQPPPRPYTVETLQFRSHDGTQLEGMFVRPTIQGPRPVVVYLSGSGDSTREDAMFVADTMARSGIATFSYDKRGAGKSGGDWHFGGYQALAEDAKAAIQMLIRRRDVDAARIGFWCHSEGCYVAPIALKVGASAMFLVAVSGPTVDPDAEELDHFRQLFRQAALPEKDFWRVEELLKLDQKVSRGQARYDEFEAELSRMTALPWFKILDWPMRPPGSPERIWHTRILEHRVKPYLDSLRAPSLWVFGSKDFIIPVTASIDALEKSSARPKPLVELMTGGDHGMTTVPDKGLPQLVPDYVEKTTRWVKQMAFRKQ
jgi:alpha-beta hydrolase superfamily lysophospholipase